MRPTQLRAFSRGIRSYLTEPHPHGRMPVTQKPHRHDAGFYVNRIRRTATWYFPLAGVILGWPVIAAEVLTKIGI